ncbi:MAG: hypothetical protein NC037_04365 [Bacteroides sp.]|nr:hypothetical protein [Bacillota bacterium]MCM1394197.1 hypothetical protein [[Eubacterium] siraeum]MCM1455745.1 hypothetical protein [Bacteroides sp.]
MDTLSLLTQILEVIVECAKVVAIIVAILFGVAFLKYLSLRGSVLLPSVKATAFVLSVVSANVAAAMSFCAFLWLRFITVFSSFSGGVTLLFVLFAIVLCYEIAMRLDLYKRGSIELFKCNPDTKKLSTAACNLSNSYLAITPVLLS